MHLFIVQHENCSRKLLFLYIAWFIKDLIRDNLLFDVIGFQGAWLPWLWPVLIMFHKTKHWFGFKV